jgi:chromosome segregation ATPase
MFAGSFNVAHADDKVDDLSVEAEATDMDVFDQQKLDQQARSENADLERQSKSLEKQIASLKNESTSLSKRVASQTERNAKLVKLQREAQALVRKFQAQRDGQKGRLENLRSRTEQLEHKLQAAQELEKSLKDDLRSQERDQAELARKQKSTTSRLDRVNRSIKGVRAKSRKVGAASRRGGRVAMNEYRSTEERAFAGEF